MTSQPAYPGYDGHAPDDCSWPDTLGRCPHYKERANTPAYPGYATPTFGKTATDQWIVRAQPWDESVGITRPNLPAGWTAWDLRFRYVGLFPDKQAAGEALVRAAGYEVLR